MFPYSVDISKVPFSENGLKALKYESQAGENSFDNWPVVYIIDDGARKYAYVGETTNIQRRLDQHFKNPVRKELTRAHIIHDHSFREFKCEMQLIRQSELMF